MVSKSASHVYALKKILTTDSAIGSACTKTCGVAVSSLCTLQAL